MRGESVTRAVGEERAPWRRWAPREMGFDGRVPGDVG